MNFEFLLQIDLNLTQMEHFNSCRKSEDNIHGFCKFHCDAEASDTFKCICRYVQSDKTPSSFKLNSNKTHEFEELLDPFTKELTAVQKCLLKDSESPYGIHCWYRRNPKNSLEADSTCKGVDLFGNQTSSFEDLALEKYFSVNKNIEIKEPSSPVSITLHYRGYLTKLSKNLRSSIPSTQTVIDPSSEDQWKQVTKPSGKTLATKRYLTFFDDPIISKSLEVSSKTSNQKFDAGSRSQCLGPSLIIIASMLFFVLRVLFWKYKKKKIIKRDQTNSIRI